MRPMLLLPIFAALACGPRHPVSGGEIILHDADPAASAVMRSSSGERLGTLHLYATTNGRLRVVGTLTGIPAGLHGIHMHAVGQCEGPGFESAGGHFNPDGKAHGLENPAGPHIGDAPNITADASTRAEVNLLMAGSLDARKLGYINDADGVSIVVHASADDQRTDPSGNSGARIACGVIGATDPPGSR
jgi:Cu-Zn family superoxide dismutase